MPNYNDISRRGLIELNNDFDKKSDNALYNFLNNSEKDYEEIRPYERVAEKLDEVTEAIQAKGGIISNAMVDRVNHIFDNMVFWVYPGKESGNCKNFGNSGKDQCPGKIHPAL